MVVDDQDCRAHAVIVARPRRRRQVNARATLPSVDGDYALQVHGLADAGAESGAKRQLGGDQIFDHVTHRLVDRYLVR